MMCASRYIYDTPIPVTKESIVIIHNYIYIYSNSKCTCTYILLQTKKKLFQKNSKFPSFFNHLIRNCVT